MSLIERVYASGGDVIIDTLELTCPAWTEPVLICGGFEDVACTAEDGRSLQLTETARMLLPGLRDGFEALERACNTLRVDDAVLRLKAPSTLTMRWLLARLSRFRHLQPGNEVQLTSAWMDVDSVDFNNEPFDCAVLLSDGHFPPDWEASLLFPEELIPVGAPNLLNDQPWDVARLASAELLHPTPDRRDWRSWLEHMGLSDQVSLKGGQVFDTLELGMIAAARGYGVSMGDLLMAEADATATTTVKAGRPTRVIRVAEVDERTIGALMMHFILETIFAAHLWKIDAFDQPAVEDAKILTRQYLSQRRKS